MGGGGASSLSGFRKNAMPVDKRLQFNEKWSKICIFSNKYKKLYAKQVSNFFFPITGNKYKKLYTKQMSNFFLSKNKRSFF